MEIEKLAEIENATWAGRKELFRLGSALLFIIAIVLFVTSLTGGVSNMLVIAAMIGGYMALNIGANDVANNVGPAVGSRAVTLAGAIIIAAIFEAAGALIAGGDVVSTIKSGIINPELIANTDTFIWVMTAALLAGALWLNLATVMGAPVSTTHSIVGGVLGAGIAAGGAGIADWGKVGQIAMSWLISPVMGGLIAAGFLYLIKHSIMYKDDRISAAKRMVPALIGLMGWAFGTYLILKGLKKIVKVDFTTAMMLGLLVGLVVWLISIITVRRSTRNMENTKQALDGLFVVPLIFAAALLSFAHGANDVANAVGPLAAISDAVITGQIASKASIPLWVMLIGAIGIALGLALYGPKLIKTVGSEITELNQTRAYCIALSAAITVIVATHFGLPVSSTHIAVGAVFGVGFLREYIKANYAVLVSEIEHHHRGVDRVEVEEFMVLFESASLAQKGHMIMELKKNKGSVDLTKKERRALKKQYRHELVKRSALLKIAAAWVITVPVSGFLAGMLYFTIRGMMV